MVDSKLLLDVDNCRAGFEEATGVGNSSGCGAGGGGAIDGSGSTMTFAVGRFYCRSLVRGWVVDSKRIEGSLAPTDVETMKEEMSS